MKKLSNIEGACAVIALRYAAKVPAGIAIEACLSQGMFDEQWTIAAKKLGLRVEKTITKRVMLRKFIGKYPDGLFLMATHNHLFVLDNGKIIDPSWNSDGLYRMILQAWRVLK